MAKTNKGWITLHKKIMDSAVWTDDKRLKAWIHILLNANFEDREQFYRGKVRTIKRGQFPTSNRALQEAWGCSTNTVNRILKQFAELGMIEYETPDNMYTLITVVKYDVYQGRGYSKRDSDGDTERDIDRDTYGDSDEDTDRDTDGVHNNNINNINKYNNYNNKTRTAPRYDPGGYEIEE